MRDFKGIFIPRELYLSRNLSWSEKILLLEIHSLDAGGGAWASNAHYAAHLQVAEQTVQNLLAGLRRKGLIRDRYRDSRRRHVSLTEKADTNFLRLDGNRNRLVSPTEISYRQQTTPYYRGSKPKEEENGPANEVTRNGKGMSEDIPYQAIIEDLNRRTGKRFRASRSARRLIRARWREGHGFDDFVAVHRNQAAKWLHDERMQQYLRPETLYTGKFQGYLNSGASTRQRSAYNREIPE